MDNDLLISTTEMKMRQQERAIAAEADLREARDLILHFQFISHGPACACAMCEKRTAWLARFQAETGADHAKRD